MLIEIQEVVALKQLIGELGERQTVACLAVKALLNALLCHHVVYGDVLAHLTRELQEAHVLHPVVVVHKLCPVGSVALKVKELGELLLYALLVVTQSLLVEQIALKALA